MSTLLPSSSLITTPMSPARPNKHRILEASGFLE